MLRNVMSEGVMGIPPYHRSPKRTRKKPPRTPVLGGFFILGNSQAAPTDDPPYRPSRGRRGSMEPSLAPLAYHLPLNRLIGGYPMAHFWRPEAPMISLSW
jgi:hypothetical protein